VDSCFLNDNFDILLPKDLLWQLTKSLVLRIDMLVRELYNN
jgi:hypothetical protein